MNKIASQRHAGLFFQPLFILVGGVLLGALTTEFSPLVATILAFLIACAGMMLYRSSLVHPTLESVNDAHTTILQPQKTTILFYLFYLSFFLSITIPKAGKTISNIPITIANLAILATLALWGIYIMFSSASRKYLPLAKPIVFLIGYGVLASLIGYLNQFALKNILTDFSAFFGFIPVYLLVCTAVKTQKHITLVLFAVTGSLLLVSLYGSLQPRLGFERIAVPGITQQSNMIIYEGVQRWNVIEGGTQKVYSTFQNGNIFGNHLALFIPFLVGILLGMRSFTKKMIMLSVFLLSCYTLTITYSRGALVGTICGILFFAMIAKKIRAKTLVIIVILCSFGIGLISVLGDRPEFNRFNLQRATADPNQFSAGRIYRAKLALMAYAKLPLAEKFLGVGLGGPHSADNLYLTLLVKIGLVGMSLLFLIFYKLFVELFRLRKSIASPHIQSLLNGGMAGLVAALIHYIVDVLWFFPPLAANFWFLAGITMCIGMISAQENNSAAGLQARAKNR